MPHPPQLYGSFDSSTHSPPQMLSSFSGHSQAAEMHCIDAGHALSHAPQLPGSVFRSTHPPAQLVWPERHEASGGPASGAHSLSGQLSVSQSASAEPAATHALDSDVSTEPQFARQEASLQSHAS
jgi:hypothetical protein